MKKILLSGSLTLLLAPALALAASFNDVTLGSSVVLSVNGITVDVSGATIESITVGSGSFDVALQPGSTMTVTAPDRNQMQYSTPVLIPRSFTCDSSVSSMSFTSDTAVTVTITPIATLCGSTSSGGSGGSGGGNGPPVVSGGGGGGGSVLPTQIGTPPIVQTSAPGTSMTLAALQAQVQMLLAQIAALSGGASGFTRDLTVGSTGSDVKALQTWLNAKGYAVASSGAGSPGNETTKFGGLTRAALAKFQAAVGITPAVGYFGPKTRAYIAAHP
jgi:hypothetical protein